MNSPGDEGPEIHRLRRRVRQLELELDGSEREVALLRNSRSFRITAPLRWIWSNLNRGPVSAAPAATVRDSDHVVQGLPASVCAMDESRQTDPNASHRTLDLDEALRPLVRVPVNGGRLQTRHAPGDPRYLGSGSSSLQIATLATIELREELS